MLNSQETKWLPPEITFSTI